MDEGKIKVLIVLAIIVLAVAGLIATPYICTDADGATRILTESSYKDIQVTGHAWFQCGKDDWYSTGFNATSPNGTRVNGTVCRGLMFKASTIRLN